MRPLAGELLLDAWEQGAAGDDVSRGLTLLALALPESSRDGLAELPLGEINRLLLHLHRLSFGPVLRGFSECPHCGARMELALPVAQMMARLDVPAAEVAWIEDGIPYRLRPVNTADLAASLAAEDEAEAQRCVLARCLDRPTWSAAALEKFEQLNAAAELTFALQCPECSCSRTQELDVSRFLWLEVRHAALRLLGEIHELAAAYGWSEDAIVRMSPQRREAYRELLSA